MLEHIASIAYNIGIKRKAGIGIDYHRENGNPEQRND